MRIVPASDSSVIVVFGDSIAATPRDQVRRLFQCLRAAGDTRIRNLHPAYASLLIDFDPLRVTHDEIIEIVGELIDIPANQREREPRCVDIPVCYDPEFGPDLMSVAAHLGMGIEEVVRAHSSVRYTVSFFGFSPGFAYLEGLPSHLAVPRLSAPRKRVEAGSVGIAGHQTGVYPLASPGGWQIIGRTLLQVFNPKMDPPTLMRLGDEVRFVPISREQFSDSASLNENRRRS